MKKTQLIIVLVIALIFPFSAIAREGMFQEFHRVAERIKIGNFINAMSLDERQVFYILSRAYEAKRFRGAAEKEMEKYYLDFLKACENLESEVEEGRVVVEKKTARDFHHTKEKMQDIKYDLDNKLDHLAGKIAGKLKDHQVYAVDQFTPCLVPKVQEGRVGQEGGNKHFIAMLEKIRFLPAHAYQNKKQSIIDRVVTHTEKRMLFLTREDIQNYRKKIEKSFDEIREMNDVDFSIQKSEIAHEIKNSFTAGKKRVQSPEDKIKKFLLSEQAIDVLKKQLR